MDTGREVSIIEDKGNVDLTHTKGHKCRMSDRENTDTCTSKKNKVSFWMRMLASLTVHIFLKKEMDFCIKFCAGKKQSTVKISVKITQL